MHYDHTAEGQQAFRAPETQTGELTGRRREWTYYADGPLKQETDYRTDNVSGLTKGLCR